MKRRKKLSVLPNLSRKKTSANTKDNESKAIPVVQDESTSKSTPIIQDIIEESATALCEPSDALKTAAKDLREKPLVAEKISVKGHDGINQHSEKSETADSAPKSPIKSPALALRLAHRPRLPKPRPNIENKDRSRKRLCSMSESEDDNVRQRNPSGPRLRNPSGPPPIQNVLRTTENASKSLVQAETCKESILVEMLRDDSQRKRHRSAVNEVEDLRRKKKMFYKKGNKPPEKSKMTMLDLIYWNPDSNPMMSNTTSETVVQSNGTKSLPGSGDSAQQARLEDEAVDEPEAPNTEGDANPAPQIKIGPDGNIIIDEKTLTVAPTEVNRENLENNPVLYEKSSSTTYASFKKNGSRTGLKRWTDKETVKFYQALCTFGTDFTMMTQILPNRTRSELKKKFRVEDRSHKNLVDQAINQGMLVDTQLFDLSDSDDAVPKKKSVKPRKKRKSNRRKPTYDWSGSEIDEPANSPVKLGKSESCDPTWACPPQISKTIAAEIKNRQSERVHSTGFDDVVDSVTKACNDSEVQQSTENVVGNVSSEGPSAAQLFLVAQKSPNQQEQIIHVYMVSPATTTENSLTPSSPSISNLTQTIPGITLLDTQKIPSDVVDTPIEEKTDGNTVEAELIIEKAGLQ